ncbi:gamma-glutamylcyclotransferase family protein [Tumebacillus flagellatus]|uniref:Gamma-glutamyl cyclotransferase n=1 Tax=Tumebacillus flagellatus TaxID=1157490 RepID=A0A074MFZ3_9BACL|nr:gamma-glutamylcyclotransferase family protein [Tumebacillus flagellatus]KEO84617.1 gamma-glutamyl cyclotransferase [Tumebacillus flagellatus]
MFDVFVYGSVLAGERNHHHIAPFLKAVQPGTLRGRLYDTGNGYPALVLDDVNGYEVVGEWYLITGAGLKKFDELEEYFGPGHPDNEYDRVQVKDLHHNREGWVYVWHDSRGCREVASGSWRKHLGRE